MFAISFLASASVALAQAPIAVQGAVDSELGPLIEALGNPEPRDIQGFRFWEGTIGGNRVVVSRTEVGMVHAAMATMILIRDYDPRVIINQGTAGGVNPELETGDIVLSRRSVPFGSFRTTQRQRGDGVALDTWEAMPIPLREGGERVRYFGFDADAELLRVALDVAYAGGKLVQGVVGSADQWNREVDKLLWAHEVYGIDSEDMESASVHQVAHIYDIPFLAIRIVSNSEHHDPQFRPEVGADCAQFTVELVKALPE
jgi:adenosylhomocysteine nucleosidase